MSTTTPSLLPPIPPSLPPFLPPSLSWIWPPYVNRAVQDEEGNNLVFSYTDADRTTDGVLL